MVRYLQRFFGLSNWKLKFSFTKIWGLGGLCKEYIMPGGRLGVQFWIWSVWLGIQVKIEPYTRWHTFQPGMEPVIWICTLTQNQTHDLSVYETMHQPTEPHQLGQTTAPSYPHIEKWAVSNLHNITNSSFGLLCTKSAFHFYPQCVSQLWTLFQVFPCPLEVGDHKIGPTILIRVRATLT